MGFLFGTTTRDIDQSKESIWISYLNLKLYISHEPILAPELLDETIGVVGVVVFPIRTDRRDDIGQPNRVDLYYGMADDRIGVAKMEIPEKLSKN